MRASRLFRMLVLGALMAGCSAPAVPTSPPASTATSPVGAQPAVTAGAPRAAPPTPTAAPPTAVPREQILRLTLTEPPTIDPGLAEDNVAVEVVAQLFEGLVAFDEQGRVSGLGAERWEISPDGLTYTFALRAGAAWSDGRPVTANDYAWAWQRAVNPRTASPYASSLYAIKNGRAIGEGRLPPEQLGAQARDDRTLVVTLEEPAAYFLRLASTWAYMPLRRDVLERVGPSWTEPKTIVTNGPFRLREWLHDEQLVLERDEQYWGQKPSLRRVIYRVFPEGGSDQMLAAYEAGELDVAGGAAGLEFSPAQATRLRSESKLASELRTFDQSGTLFVAVNTRRPHLTDARVRQALGQALDRRKILDDVLRRPGQPADGLQPPGIAGRRPHVWPREDPEAARRLLAEAGFPGGSGFPELTFTYNNSAQWKLLADHLQQRWRETLGIRLRTEPREWSAFLDFVRGEEWDRRGDLYRGGWFSDYEDPHNWYDLLWDSRGDPLTLRTGWRNDQYDSLTGRAARATDPGTRESLYGQAEEILAREYPAIPILHFASRALVKPYVQGYLPERVLGVTPLRRMVLADPR